MNLNLFCPIHLTNYLPVMLAANDTEIIVQVADIKNIWMAGSEMFKKALHWFVRGHKSLCVICQILQPSN